jgi:membrane associated rhomboid family serine protease
MIPIRDNITTERIPVVTVVLIVINALVFLYEATLPEDQLIAFLFHYGYIPAKVFSPEAVRFHYMTQGYLVPDSYSLAEGLMPAFTSMFLHGGWLHVIGNMWILWIFGNNVEDRLGKVGYLAFYVFCGLTSGLVQTISAPGSPIVNIGASGAIAGVMGAYMVLYPRAMVMTLIPIFYFLYVRWLPAFLFLFVWFAIQIFSGVADVAVSAPGREMTGGIAWWAHVGGFLAGAGFILATGLRGEHAYSPTTRRTYGWSGRRRSG